MYNRLSFFFNPREERKIDNSAECRRLEKKIIDLDRLIAANRSLASVQFTLDRFAQVSANLLPIHGFVGGLVQMILDYTADEPVPDSPETMLLVRNTETLSTQLRQLQQQDDVVDQVVPCARACRP